MSKISDEGIWQVLDAYESAVDREDLLNHEYQLAQEKTKELLKAVHCPHDELEDASNEGMMQTRCTKCGFIWQD